MQCRGSGKATTKNLLASVQFLNKRFHLSSHNAGWILKWACSGVQAGGRARGGFSLAIQIQVPRHHIGQRKARRMEKGGCSSRSWGWLNWTRSAWMQKSTTTQAHISWVNIISEPCRLSCPIHLHHNDHSHHSDRFLGDQSSAHTDNFVPRRAIVCAYTVLVQCRTVPLCFKC